MNPYPIAEETIDREAYLIMSIICSSKNLKDIEPKTKNMSFIRRMFELSELSTRILSFAIMVRSCMDGSNNTFDTPVGVLIPSISTPDKTCHLTLREACNKIIHALDMDFSNGEFEVDEGFSIAHKVMLEGKHHKKHWRAELDLVHFIDESLNINN
jgi:hypothetical protein